jgi:hypothetical protein
MGRVSGAWAISVFAVIVVIATGDRYWRVWHLADLAPWAMLVAILARIYHGVATQMGRRWPTTLWMLAGPGLFFVAGTRRDAWDAPPQAASNERRWR